MILVIHQSTKDKERSGQLSGAGFPDIYDCVKPRRQAESKRAGPVSSYMARHLVCLRILLRYGGTTFDRHIGLHAMALGDLMTLRSWGSRKGERPKDWLRKVIRYGYHNFGIFRA